MAGGSALEGGEGEEREGAEEEGWGGWLKGAPPEGRGTFICDAIATKLRLG